MTAAASQERELNLRVRALNKAVTSNEPAPSILALLEVIKKDVAPSEELIRSTKAGVVIGKLRANANKDVARTAAEIVAKWKKGVDAAKAAKQRGKMASPAGTPKAASPAPTPSSASKPFTGNTEKRHWKTEGVELTRTGSEVRDNITGLFYNGLAFRSTTSPEQTLIKAIEVEDAGFKAFKGETRSYKEKMRSLFMNLKNNKNAHLRRGVMSGDITPDQFVVMTGEELLSAEQRLADAALREENMKKAQVPMGEQVISETMTCPKCGGKQVSYTQAQTRSADEPMTTFASCGTCGNHWRF